jgi:hypothetical protein
MAPIPRPVNHTVEAIYRAYAESRARSYEGLGVSISNLGEECERAVWYGFRWASPPEVVTGLKAITFETGDIEEERLLTALRMIGCEVVDRDERGRQFRYSAAGGHIRGKADGRTVGLPEAPKTWHMVECKSAKEKYYNEIVKKGVKLGYYAHYVQLLTYCYLAGMDRGLYLCRNKNTGEVYAERIEVDREEAIRLIARAERIIHAAEPPPKLHEDPEAKMAWKCRSMCAHMATCHERAFARVTCRTCIHATPLPHGDAEWNCARFGKPLSPEEQRAGCPAHLFIPATVPGEVVEVDEDAETVTYRLGDGSAWTDGAKNDGAAA